MMGTLGFAHPTKWCRNPLSCLPFYRFRVKTVKYSEFRRWLQRQGAVFTPAKGSHWKVTLNGRTAIFPDHGAKEIPRPLAEAIKKDLGLK